MIVITGGHTVLVEETGRVSEDDKQIGRVAQHDGVWAAWTSAEVATVITWSSDGHASQAAALAQLFTHLWGVTVLEDQF